MPKEAFFLNHISNIIMATSLSVPASHASAMTVDEFLPKAEKLMNAGIGAMFSKHRKPVSAEMNKVTTGHRAEITAAQIAGEKTNSCPPKKAGLKGKEFLSYLQNIPKTKRDMQVKTAFHGFMAKKYPC